MINYNLIWDPYCGYSDPTMAIVHIDSQYKTDEEYQSAITSIEPAVGSSGEGIVRIYE